MSGQSTISTRNTSLFPYATIFQSMFGLGQMSLGFVHDFRNILAVISARLNLAKRHNSDPDLSNTFLTGAQEGVARGMRMTKRPLDFASGQDCQIRPENVDRKSVV